MKENIYLRFPSHTEEINFIRFPGGEIGPRINTGNQYPERVDKVEIVARLTSPGDVMALLLVNDAVRREYPLSDISAFIPYMPYARQDRVSQRGESLSIAVMANLINGCNFSRVKVLDPHSDVTSALVDRIDVFHQFEVFHNIHTSWREIYIVAPDGGAAKKSEMFAKKVGAAGVIHCTKIRDTETGHISGTRVTQPVEGLSLLVLDDIGDGCGTFVPLGNSLKEQGAASVSLAITHGIFSKGPEVVTSIFEQVFTTNSYHRELKSEGNLIVLNVTNEVN